MFFLMFNIVWNHNKFQTEEKKSMSEDFSEPTANK